ncbi:MAG: hypothetical protein AB8G22_08375 [Saprospiraceae bacterium]
MKTTNQPTAAKVDLKKFANVTLTAKQTSMIKGGTGDSNPPTTAIVDDFVNG